MREVPQSRRGVTFLAEASLQETSRAPWHSSVKAPLQDWNTRIEGMGPAEHACCCSGRKQNAIVTACKGQHIVTVVVIRSQRSYCTGNRVHRRVLKPCYL